MQPNPPGRLLRSAVLAVTLAVLLLALAPPAQATTLGATISGSSVQFAVFSANATRIEVWIFATPTASTPTATYALTQTDLVNHYWTVTVPSLSASALYGYRAWGPNWTYNASWTPGSSLGFVSHVDTNGNRFNPNKLLTDPYAKAVTGEPQRVADGSGNFHYSTAILGGTGTYANVDSAGAMPKSIVLSDTFDWTGDVKPNGAMKDEIIYEAHLRGATAQDTSLSTTIRGTYDGIAAKAAYYKGLGVTAVELMPVHEYPQFDDPVGGATQDRINYWGYMTTQFFAPNREYACPDTGSCAYVAGEQVAKFKSMVKAFHAQGIEVWMDVVFNHTWEGGACSGNAVRYINLRGLDNASYYTLADDKTCYWDSTGTGNNLNGSRANVQKLVQDSLTYWITQMHVDGFRFDLAYELGREGSDGRVFNSNAAMLTGIASVGSTNGAKMVAEPWDTSGFGVGSFPSGWSEWNGPYRDNLRQFMKGDNSQVSTLGSSITGSGSGFTTPSRSVNFVTAHDGFTLNDLVTYNTKQNGVGPCNPTGADATSGSDTNYSWDSGGDDVLRRRQIRNFGAQMLLDQGVPMLLAGDELRRSQSGNNNGYMADNSCGWINWQNLTDNAKFYNFFAKLAAFRKAHPALRRSTALSGTDHDSDGYPDIGWHGTTPNSPDWSSTSHSLAFLLDGSAAETGGSSSASDVYVAYNAYWGNLTFTLPTAPNSKCWWLLADTADWAEGTGNIYYDPTVSAWDSQQLQKITGTTYGVEARSTLVLLARSCTAAASVRVDFTVNGFTTSPGQDLYVSGNVPELGNWDVTKAVKLNFVSTSQWSGPVFFTTSKGTGIQYKYLMRQGATTTWETGANRSYSVPASGSGSVTDSWRF